eukprot:501347-Pyramimonas_sp.AAC.1
MCSTHVQVHSIPSLHHGAHARAPLASGGEIPQAMPSSPRQCEALFHRKALCDQELPRREPAVDRVVEDQLGIADHGAKEMWCTRPATTVLVTLPQVVTTRPWGGVLLIPAQLPEFPLGEALDEGGAARCDVCQRDNLFAGSAARPTTSPRELFHELGRGGDAERSHRVHVM